MHENTTKNRQLGCFNEERAELSGIKIQAIEKS
jgi:hypothetical protein